MRFFARLSRLANSWRRQEDRATRVWLENGRVRRFETMEPRRMLAADLLQIGAVFTEADLGSDVQGDTFEITFEGGAPGTELTRLVIEGDQGAPGFGEGDVFFDVLPTGLGADNSFPFTMLSIETVDPSAEVQATVLDGETTLALDLVGFRAGDKLLFSIDVDEVEDFDPVESRLDLINEGIDPITSGVEFQGSRLTAEFSAPHYHDVSGEGEFRNRYDDALVGTNLDLPTDDQFGQRDRTDGVVVSLQQEPLPVSISGYVYHDRNDDGFRDPGEEGLEGVRVDVIPLTTLTPQDAVSLVTNADGHYSTAGLAPGTYRVVEPSQPAGFFDGQDRAGTVAGEVRGEAVNPGDRLDDITLLGGDAGTEYNFGELLPASLGGRVHLSDANGDCFEAAPATNGLSGVLVQLFDASGDLVAETATDASGDYRFEDLLPGEYRLVEHTPSHLLDGAERVGSVAGQARGELVGNDTIASIRLSSGEEGLRFDFCEHEPAMLSGYVFHDFDNSGTFEDGEQGIANTEVVLLDDAGQVVASQLTNGDGFYKFDRLRAGTYSVREVQPAGWIDGIDAAGTIGGQTVGVAENPGDRIREIQLQFGDDAVRYDFGELAPIKIGGFVYHDQNNNGVKDSGEEGIEGVTLQVIPLDSHAPQTSVNVVTDADGMYMTGMIAPGRYRIVETEQPTGYLDGLDSPGTVNGVSRGDAQNPGDRIDDILLNSGETGMDYNFGELLPAAIRGHVQLSDGHGDCFDEAVDHAPVVGAEVSLLNDRQQVIATTVTDGNGQYSFEGLLPGSYSIMEVTPDGLLDGAERAGEVAGRINGAVTANDTITGIELLAGEVAINYDFCEHLPAGLSGHVYHDRDNDGQFEVGEEGIGSVDVELVDAAGQVVQTAQTNRDGFYRFADLLPGIYSVREIHPAGWDDGIDSVGVVSGQPRGEVVNPGDAIRRIRIEAGDHGTDYNFGEIQLASVGGIVHLDPNNNCVVDEGETPLVGVTVQLLDGDGAVVATTTTDAQGRYRFEGLLPGEYAIRELQPEGYFHGGQRAGSAGPVFGEADLLPLTLSSGDQLEDYNFCERPPSRLSGYVFQDGANIVTPDGQPPADLEGIRDGLRTPDDTPIPGVVIELRDGLSGETIYADSALPGYYPEGPIRAVTDANGFYEFTGLPGNASFAVFELHPSEYVDGIDTAGTTSGLAINPSALISEFLINRLATSPKNDAIILIPLGVGENSQENNFSEILVEREAVPAPPVPQPFVPIQLPNVVTPPLLASRTELPRPIPAPTTIPSYGGGVGFTWHLSIVDAGMPRGVTPSESVNATVWHQATFLEVTNWQSERLRDARWTVRHDDFEGENEERLQEIIFGREGAIPVFGDFNGDGQDEVGIYLDGEWFVDLNGNGRWDENDLWAKLGGTTDQPVTGDWDGDGKDDIGIFGPEWPHDARAIQAEPGLPDALNRPKGKPKNPPPEPEDATDGVRLLRLHAHGPRRADLIDHVFRFGAPRDIPVAADMDGDGISSIGVFRDGQWRLDVDGDGRFGEHDQTAVYGGPGDLPVVGDFDGDGVQEIGIYRAGQWHIDANHNLEMDAHDRVFEMGGDADRPVVGDWDGDGADEPGVYREE